MTSKSKNILIITLTAFIALACAFMIMASSRAYAQPNYDISIENNGAGVKIMEEGGSGLRFVLNLEAQNFADLQDDTNTDRWVDGASVGMLLVPAKYYDGEITVDSENDYIIKQELAPKNWRDSELSGYKTSYVAVYDFPETYYTEDIIAVGYVQNGATVEYTKVVTRSMAQVAFLYDEDDKEFVKDYWYDSVNGTNREMTVKFDTDGAAEIADKKVAIGSAIGSFANPVKQGLVFDKWYDVTDSEKTAWDLENSLVTKNLTLKAAFREKTVHTMSQIAEFEVYDSCSTPTGNPFAYTLTANDLDIDLSTLNLDLSGDVDVKIIKGTNEVDANYSISGNVLSVSGDDFGSAIYGTDVVVKITTTTDIVNAPIGKVVTKYLSTTDDVAKMIFYGNIDYSSEGKNYDGYFILKNEIDFKGAKVAYRRDCENIADIFPEGEVNHSGSYGFKGIFDGQNFEIKNVVHEGGKNNYSGKAGLFLNATKDAVIKNFIYTVAHKVNPNWGWAYGVLGGNIAASIENVVINLSFANGSSETASGDNFTAPVAYNLTHARLKNVTVNYDAENARANAKITALCSYQSSYASSGWQNNQAKFDNVVANVTVPSNYAKEVKSFSAYEGSYEVSLTGLTINVIKNQHITDTTAYEVYSGVSGETATYNANKLATTFDVNGGTISKVTVKGVNNTSAIEVASDKYSYADNTLSIDPSVFGSTVYGDVTITVNTDKGAIVVTKPIITKYMSSKADIERIIFYGGIDTTSTLKNYDGYFVMTQNIDMGNSMVDYRHEWTYTKDYFAEDVSGNAGFTGIFDGKGFTMYNHYAEWTQMGLFGNISTKGILRNVGLVSTINTTTAGTAKYPNVLARHMAGTIENSYFNVTLSATMKESNVQALAMNMMYAKLKDVVVKFDASTLPTTKENTTIAVLAGEISPVWQWTTNNPVCTNVNCYVKTPDSYTKNVEVASYYGASYGPHTLSGLIHHDYDATDAVSMTDKTHWTITQGAQITWAQLANIS